MAMEHILVVDDVPIKPSIYRGFPIVMFDYRIVNVVVSWFLGELVPKRAHG